MLFDHFLASNYFLLGCLFSPDEQCPLLGPARITLLLACMVFIKMSPSGIKSVSVSMFRLHAAVIYSGQSRGRKPKDAPSRHQHPAHRNHLLAFSPAKGNIFYLQAPPGIPAGTYCPSKSKQFKSCEVVKQITE